MTEFIKSAFLILSFVFFGLYMHGQKYDLIKHKIELSYPTYYFFDENPYLLNHFKKKPKGISNGEGLRIAYSLNLDDLRAMSISAEYYGAFYSSPCRQCRDGGDILDRETYYIRLRYYRTLYDKKISISGLGGLVYREGKESMVLGYPRWFEIATKNHKLHDVGLTVGARVTKPISKRFELSLENSFTYFAFRFDRGYKSDPYRNVSFDKGSTKFLLNFDFNIGYYFMIKSPKEASYVE